MSSIRIASVTGVVVAAALILATIGLGLRSDAPPDRPGIDRRVEAIGDNRGEPLAGGVRMDLGEAVDVVGFDLQRPDTDLAADASIDAVWVRGRGDGAKVWIEYESGVAVSIQSAANLQDLSTYKKAQEADGVPLTVERVGDRDTILIPPGEGSGGALLLWLDDVAVRVYGNGGISSEQLLSLGSSIVARADATEALS
jgi:hypothetical protein